jgi:hypothetical protein
MLLIDFITLNQIGKVYALDDAVKSSHEGGEMMAQQIPIQSSLSWQSWLSSKSWLRTAARPLSERAAT